MNVEEIERYADRHWIEESVGQYRTEWYRTYRLEEYPSVIIEIDSTDKIGEWDVNNVFIRSMNFGVRNGDEYHDIKDRLRNTMVHLNLSDPNGSIRRATASHGIGLTEEKVGEIIDKLEGDGMVVHGELHYSGRLNDIGLDAVTERAEEIHGIHMEFFGQE